MFEMSKEEEKKSLFEGPSPANLEEGEDGAAWKEASLQVAEDKQPSPALLEVSEEQDGSGEGQGSSSIFYTAVEAS